MRLQIPSNDPSDSIHHVHEMVLVGERIPESIAPDRIQRLDKNSTNSDPSLYATKLFLFRPIDTNFSNHVAETELYLDAVVCSMVLMANL